MIPGIMAGQMQVAASGGIGPVALTITSAGSPDDFGASVAVPYPAVVSANDLIVMFVGVGSNRTVSTPAGYTPLGGRTASGTALSSSVFYKLAAGTEGGGTVTINISGAANVLGLLLQVQAGTFNIVTPCERSALAAPSLPSQADSPLLAPTWGGANTLWVSSVVGDTILGKSVTAWPYANGQARVKAGGASTGASVPELFLCHGVVNAASQDPAQLGTSANFYAWVADTVAVQPA